jgi:uncharacterized protein (DUF433 family)
MAPFREMKKLGRDLQKQVEYEKKNSILERMSMTVLEQKPLTLSVPLREDPEGVLRVGKSRVLLELVIHAHQRGAAPQDIVRMYDTLDLGDVYAVWLIRLKSTSIFASATSKRKPSVAKLNPLSRPGPT